MAGFAYTWGMEPPRLHQARHLRLVEVVGQAALERAREAYEATVARILRDVETSQQRIEVVRLSTPGGRYNSEIAAGVAAQFGLFGSSEQAKRGRGRPRKYGPDDARPARPSRAKTAAGRLRSATVQYPKRGERNAGTVSSVTSSPARSIAPKAASEVGRQLLQTTMVAERQVDPIAAEDIHVAIVVSEDAITALPQAEPAPELEAALSAELIELEIYTQKRELMVLHSSLLDDGEEAAFVEADRGQAALSLHQVYNHAVSSWKPRADRTVTLDYDFSDPSDITKVKPEVLALFPGFGMSRHRPTLDRANPDEGMSEADVDGWNRVALFKPNGDTEEKIQQYYRIHGGPRGFCYSFRSTMEEFINEERHRFVVWHRVANRIEYVERYYQLHVDGLISLEASKVQVAYLDLKTTGQIAQVMQPLYQKILDAMTWFEGFSRVELCEWAGSDPEIVRTNKRYEGFPRWQFPEWLHDPIQRGRFNRKHFGMDYEPPAESDLTDFSNRMEATEHEF